MVAWASPNNNLLPVTIQVPEPARPSSTCVNPVVRLQLVLEAKLLATAVTLIGLLPCVDALVALECALIPEAAAAEFTLIWVVTCENNGLDIRPLLPPASVSGTAGDIRCPAFAYIHHLIDPTR